MASSVLQAATLDVLNAAGIGEAGYTRRQEAMPW